MGKLWQGNKAINHKLITNDPDYQSKAMLYNVLASKLMSDGRSLNPRIRQDISRANNLLNAESTALFEPVLNKVQQLYKENPELKDVPFETALSLVRGPLNKTASEMSMIRGWHGGEIHHGVPAGSVAAITANQSYENWGDTLYGAGRELPITSQAYSGLLPLSAPAHNLAHFDPINRQFFKGEGAHGAHIILPGTSNADAIHSLVDQVTPQLRMSRFAGQVDEPFLKELAYILSSDGPHRVTAKDLTSTMYHPTGRGSTVAAWHNKLTNPSHVNAATNAAYGTTNAVEAAANVIGTDQIRSSREAMDARNAAARKERELSKQGLQGRDKSGLATVVSRPGTEEAMARLGLEYVKLMGNRFA